MEVLVFFYSSIEYLKCLGRRVEQITDCCHNIFDNSEFDQSCLVIFPLHIFLFVPAWTSNNLSWISLPYHSYSCHHSSASICSWRYLEASTLASSMLCNGCMWLSRAKIFPLKFFIHFFNQVHGNNSIKNKITCRSTLQHHQCLWTSRRELSYNKSDNSPSSIIFIEVS